MSSATAQQRGQPYYGRYLRSAQHGFRAERGIFVDDQIFQVETGTRKETQVNRTNVGGAGDGAADGVSDAGLQPRSTWAYQE